MALLATPLFAGNTDPNTLLGIHWYSNTDAISIGQSTDVEAMSSNNPLWVLEITHLDIAVAPAWDQPGYFNAHSQKVTTGKGHQMIFRVQPYWNRHVPHASDPYTLTQFANDAKSMATTFADQCHIWQIGNEVNITSENTRWNTASSAYDIQWTPTPAEYAATYVAVRDKIHEVTPNAPLPGQVVVMQPNSPGAADAARFMDGNEFLFRSIDAVADKSKIDGFALHSYAEPGAADFGVEGFMDGIREQLMIIDSFGLTNRPAYITEFNKHMPSALEANVGAKFLHRAYQALADWNAGVGGQTPGLANHNVRGATWFVYRTTGPADVWNEYSLAYWKTQIASTDKDLNPWYSFQHAAAQNHPAGAAGGGVQPSASALWWSDDFNTLDTTPSLPDWKVEKVTAASTATISSGKLALKANGEAFGGATVRTAGYVYSDFRAEATFTIVNGATGNGAAGESNFDFRIREGSQAYSLTFYTANSNTRANQVWLRRTNNWAENIGGFNATIPGGLGNGKTIKVVTTANGTSINYRIYTVAGAVETEVVNWNVTDSGQRVGWVRFGTYNMNEAQVDRFAIGGTSWTGTPASADDWSVY